MTKPQKYSKAARAASAILSMILLWSFGITLLLVVLNVGIGFPYNAADFRQSFVQMEAIREESNLNNYIQMALRSDGTEGNYDSVMSFDSSLIGMTMNLHTYEQHFDPEITNYRFSVTDAEGSLLLTNDPQYGSDRQLLGSSVTTQEFIRGQRSYQIQKHFDNPEQNFQEIVYGDMSQYLENPQDFLLWYFSNTDIDAAYHGHMMVKTFEDRYTDYMFFHSEQDAQSFNYERAYGERCTWRIISEAPPLSGAAMEKMQAVSGNEPETTAGEPEAETDTEESAGEQPDYIVVEINAYSTQNEFETTLESYYNMKAGDIVVVASDPKLEKVLSEGLDITIRGEHTDILLCYIRSYLYEHMDIDDTISSNYAVFSALFQHSDRTVVLMFILLVLTVLACIAMCTTAGYSGENGELVVSRVHTLAYEFYWLLPPLSIAASYMLLLLLGAIETPYRLIAIFCVGMILCIAACCILWLYTTAIRSKAGTFWTSFGIFRLFSFLFSLFKNRTFACISFLAYSAGMFVYNVVALLSSSTFMIVTALVIDLLTLLFMMYSVYAYFELHRHVKQMETGDFSPAKHPVPLCADFRNFDRSLNEITSRVGDIVAQQTKAEHLRTELITNVSHDLKTPLTSIVNYVDLLSREPMQTETAREYLEVLRRQAARLKKLTIDLVDASKASTGNLTVELMPTDIQVLLSQIAGEYEEQLAKKSLSLILNTSEEPLMILADGRQIWRVFDNLLNNACKYALTGTRVYLDVKTKDDHVTISLKNISAQPLNVSPDELMERFVRGDASRHTEGSGLGLSIARDLTALQNGILRLSTDGDLFKAHLTFPLYHPPEKTENDADAVTAEGEGALSVPASEPPVS